MKKYEVLILTYWNVNPAGLDKMQVENAVLILTYWNVNKSYDEIITEGKAY